MQFPDSSIFYNTISPALAAGTLISLRRQGRAYYFFPAGSVFIENPLGIQNFSNLSVTEQAFNSLYPLSINFGSSPAIKTTLTGSTVYTLSGKNELGDPMVINTTTISPINSPSIKSFSAATYSNQPNNPLQIVYQSQNVTNVTITSTERALNVPSDAFEGTLIINNPQDGEVIDFVFYNSATNQTEQIKITVDNSEKVFLCDIKDPNEMEAPTEAIFYGSGAVTLDISGDDTRLYCGRANTVPAIIYLNAYPIQSNNVLNMRLSDPETCFYEGYTFPYESYISDGTVNILSFRNEKIYFCQPAGDKITYFDGLTQQATGNISQEKPLNVETNNLYIVTKSNEFLSIYDINTNQLLQQFTINLPYNILANDKEIFISEENIFYVDGNKIKVISLLDISTVAQEIEFSQDLVLNSCITFSSTRNVMYVVYSKQTGFAGTGDATEPKVEIYRAIINVQNQEIIDSQKITDTNRGDCRFTLRIEKDEERIFLLIDQLNTVYAFSNNESDNYKQVGFYNLLKPSGIALSNNGKHMYYTAQTESSWSLNTQKPRSLIVLRLFETKLNIEFL